MAALTIAELERRPTSTMSERDLLRRPKPQPGPDQRPRPKRGDGPPLSEAELFAAYSIGVREAR